MANRKKVTPVVPPPTPKVEVLPPPVEVATTPEASYDRHTRRMKKERVKVTTPDGKTVTKVQDRTLLKDAYKPDELAFKAKTGLTFGECETIRNKATAHMMKWVETNYGADVKPYVNDETTETVLDAQAVSLYNAEEARIYLQLLEAAGYKRRPNLFLREGMTAETESKMPKTKKTKTPKTTLANPNAVKRATKDVETKHGTFRDGTVLLEIYRAFDLANGATPQEILERLAAKFPERNNAQGLKEMMVTIRTQINRMPKERKFKLGRDDKGRYGLHIEGHSNVRILSPEAQAKLEARQAKAAAKEAAEKAKKVEKKAKEVVKKASKSPEDKEAAKKAKEAEKAAAEAAQRAKDAKMTEEEARAELAKMGIRPSN